jgi:Lysylphosphatidylglycerol synthase TM region
MIMIVAFHVPAPPEAALLVLVVTNLGAAIPSSPASLGVYHVLAVLALSVWNIDTTVAVAFAIGFARAGDHNAYSCGPHMRVVRGMADYRSQAARQCWQFRRRDARVSGICRGMDEQGPSNDHVLVAGPANVSCQPSSAGGWKMPAFPSSDVSRRPTNQVVSVSNILVGFLDDRA